MIRIDFVGTDGMSGQWICQNFAFSSMNGEPMLDVFDEVELEDFSVSIGELRSIFIRFGKEKYSWQRK